MKNLILCGLIASSLAFFGSSTISEQKKENNLTIKAPNAGGIRIEFQNKNGAADVYLIFENNKPHTGTGRVGKKMIVSYEFAVGAVVKVKGGGVIYNVTANTKSGTRVQL